MKYYLLSFLALTLFISACSPSADEKNGEVKASTQTVVKAFSDSIQQDTFKVQLIGNKPKNMVLSFSITNTSGTRIFSKDLKAANILDNYKESIDLSKEETQKNFIVDEFEIFLSEENFLEPAITAEEQPDAQSPDHMFYQELKTSGLNGFKFRMGKETNVYIGWFKKDQEVKIYYTCCKIDKK